MQQAPGRGAAAVGRGVGQVADRAFAGQPLEDRPLVGLELGQRRRQVGRQLAAAARPPGGPAPPGCRTARRTGSGARRTSSPHSSARLVSRSSAGRPGRRRGRRAARRRSRRGRRRRSGRAARRRAPAASRRPARPARGPPTPGRRAGWPAPRRRTAPGGRRRAGPPAGRSAARRCGCAARRRASQGGPWASGPRYVVAATPCCEHGGVPPAADDPGPVPTWTPTRRAALRWLAGGGIAVVLGVLLGVAVVTSRRAAGGGSPASVSSSSRWSWSAIVAAIVGTGALLRAAPVAPGLRRDAVAARPVAHRRPGGPRLRAGGLRRARPRRRAGAAAAAQHRGLADAGRAADGRRRGARRARGRRASGCSPPTGSDTVVGARTVGRRTRANP